MLIADSWWKTNAARLSAVVVLIALFAAAKSPDLAPPLSPDLVRQFRFQRLLLTKATDVPAKSVRIVHPSLRRLSGWISTVGAAVALGDVDGDGLSNDLCHVDPRTDLVTVSPAPSTGDRFPAFRLTPSAKLYNSETMAPMGCLINDLNEDGLADMVVYYWGRSPIAFVRKAGSASDRPGSDSYSEVDLVPTGERWFSNAGFFADVDGDGHPDLIIGNYFKDGSRILDANAGGIEQMHNTKSRSFTGGSKRILLWRSGLSGDKPSVHYEDAGKFLPDEQYYGWTLAAGAADLDGDMLPEIYLSNDFGPDRLLHNDSQNGHLKFSLVEGRRTASNPRSFVLGQDSFKGMSVDFADLNGDGVPDIYVSNIADDFALQESHFLWLSTGDRNAWARHEAPYRQASEQLGLSRSGWGWDARLADFNNDGKLEAVQGVGFLKGEINRWPELQALGTGNDSLMHDPNHWPKFVPGDDVSGRNTGKFFVQGPGGRFQNIAASVGMDEPFVTRGIAIADVNGDGKLDFAMANQWNDSYLFLNQSPSDSAFLGLHLIIPIQQDHKFEVLDGHAGRSAVLGRPAIGAAVTVYLPDGRQLFAQSDGGSGHSGKRSPDVHFGLGAIAKDTPLRVEVKWRDAHGRIRQSECTLKAGWHSVILGA